MIYSVVIGLWDRKHEKDENTRFGGELKYFLYFNWNWDFCIWNHNFVIKINIHCLQEKSGIYRFFFVKSRNIFATTQVCGNMTPQPYTYAGYLLFHQRDVIFIHVIHCNDRSFFKDFVLVASWYCFIPRFVNFCDYQLRVIDSESMVKVFRIFL